MRCFANEHSFLFVKSVIHSNFFSQATRYNYNSEERFAMIEVISMIKSVQTQLLRLEAYYSEAIRRSVYRELQTIVVGQLSGPLAKAQKKKDRINLVRLIYAIQATCADQVSVYNRFIFHVISYSVCWFCGFPDSCSAHISFIPTSTCLESFRSQWNNTSIQSGLFPV